MFPVMVSKTDWYSLEVKSLAEECFYSFNIYVSITRYYRNSRNLIVLYGNFCNNHNYMLVFA